MQYDIEQLAKDAASKRAVLDTLRARNTSGLSYLQLTKLDIEDETAFAEWASADAALRAALKAQKEA